MTERICCRGKYIGIVVLSTGFSPRNSYKHVFLHKDVIILGLPRVHGIYESHIEAAEELYRSAICKRLDLGDDRVAIYLYKDFI